MPSHCKNRRRRRGFIHPGGTPRHRTLTGQRRRPASRRSTGRVGSPWFLIARTGDDVISRSSRGVLRPRKATRLPSRDDFLAADLTAPAAGGSLTVLDELLEPFQVSGDARGDRAHGIADRFDGTLGLVVELQFD